MLKPLKEHAQAIRDAKAFIDDELLSERSRKGAERHLQNLLDNYVFCDGYVSRIDDAEWSFR